MLLFRNKKKYQHFFDELWCLIQSYVNSDGLDQPAHLCSMISVLSVQPVGSYHLYTVSENTVATD